MKKMSTDVLRNITENAGVNITSTSNVIGTLEVSLNRQAARTPQRRIVLDQTNIPQIREALSIGSGITRAQANDVLQQMRQTLSEQHDPEIKLFDDSTFLLEGGELVFKLDEKE
jgi:hypothetical protein